MGPENPLFGADSAKRLSKNTELYQICSNIKSEARAGASTYSYHSKISAYTNKELVSMGYKVDQAHPLLYIISWTEDDVVKNEIKEYENTKNKALVVGDY